MCEPPVPGMSVLLTGLSGAGKTTVANAAAERLSGDGLAAEVLDGDVVRRELWPELGLSETDREQNLHRIGRVAALLARNGVVVLVSAIAPYARARDWIRSLHERSGVCFAEVHVATPLAVCRSRDVKGLYARQARGEITGLTGVDAVYERPSAPELRLDTSTEQVGSSVERLCRLVSLHRHLSPEGAVR